jgi:hypothetical protein
MHEVSTKIGGHYVMEEDEQKLQVRLVGRNGRRRLDEPRIIGAIGVYDQRASQRAKVDQMMPIPSIASQSRRLDAIDRSYIAGADLCHKPFKSRPFHAA